MGTCPITKTWWFLEAYDGSWLANIEHELFTRDPNEALKWPNRTRADQARSPSNLHHALWLKIKEATEHQWVPPSPPAPAGLDSREGWKLLPVKYVDAKDVTRPGITNEMVDAFWSAWVDAEARGRGHYESTYAAWNAAAEVAPAHPEVAEMPGRVDHD